MLFLMILRPASQSHALDLLGFSLDDSLPFSARDSIEKFATLRQYHSHSDLGRKTTVEPPLTCVALLEG